MYAAKAAGAGRYSLCQADMHGKVVAHARLARDLRDVVANTELRLVYQPQVALVTGKKVGVEALVRWEHPEHGLITPDRFIPVADCTSALTGGRRFLGRRLRAAPPGQVDDMKMIATENGPLKVEDAGSLELFDHDGSAVDLTGRDTVFLCRCGGSTNKPFCDGTHSKTGFEGARAAVESSGDS